MEFKVKNGYVLVEQQQEGFNFNIVGDFISAKIVVGAPEDLGVIVFTDKYKAFSHSPNLLLVKIEDVAVFIKPEAPVVADESAAA